MGRQLVSEMLFLADAIGKKILSFKFLNSAARGNQKVSKYPHNISMHLENWFHLNSSHPYLTRKQISLLSERTNLSSKQIRNWMSNRRRKSKKNPIDSSLHSLLNLSSIYS
uniref:Mating type alpha2 protein n=1 Tax=Kluyveromyces waltii TaxID=4914 RepID=A6H5D6_KLUWA|nr:mating type alpha2 protein [Lachancea waltii]